MFSYEFKERHPTLCYVLAGALITFFAGWLYLYGVAWFFRAVLKLKDAYLQQDRDYIILFFPDKQKSPKPGD
ncbi:MAG: hypothetical protein Q7S09_00425 [bacterium]|nr:hypothetical protein [bacterium]